jgi:hypothetical protein
VNHSTKPLRTQPSALSRGPHASAGAPKHAPGARRGPFVVLVLALVLGGLGALLALNTAAAANELRRRGIADSDQSAAARVVQLQNEVAASAAPGNLAAAAVQLGMAPVGNPAFLVVGTDGRVRMLGSPAAVPAVLLAPPSVPSSTTPAKSTTPARRTRTTSTAKSSTTATRHAAAHTTTHTATHTATHRPHSPSPTPTPTPNSTVPGGPR